MRILLLSLLVLNMANATNTWYNWQTTVSNLPNWLAITLDYKFPFWYGTGYHSGDGPYYTTQIFKAMTSNDHYEEYGLIANLTFETSILIDIGASGSEAYELKTTFETEFLAFNIR